MCTCHGRYKSRFSRQNFCFLFLFLFFTPLWPLLLAPGSTVESTVWTPLPGYGTPVTRRCQDGVKRSQDPLPLIPKCPQARLDMVIYLWPCQGSGCAGMVVALGGVWPSQLSRYAVGGRR
ncbi:hypothetical protein BKA57DRAFT_119721 [Linnemannia elongata]|nr:hypothetical protein BKA57DRAFT_119721 [Linnemannia elongata]